MPLQKQEISIVFTDGVDTKTDEKIATKLSVLENAFIGQRATVQKRYGLDQLNKEIVNATDYGATTPLASGELIFSNKNKLGILTKDTVAIYNDQNTEKWHIPNAQGLNCELTIDSIDFPQMSGTPRGIQAIRGASDIVVCGNYITTSGEYATSIIRKNITDGSVIALDRVEATADSMDSGRIVKLNSKIYWMSKQGANIFAFDVSTYSATVATLGPITDAMPSTQYEVFSENDLIVVVYTETSGDLKVVTFNDALAVQNSFVHTTETRTITGGQSVTWTSIDLQYSVFYVTTNAGVMYHNAIRLDASLTMVGAISTLNLGSAYDSIFLPQVSSSFNGTSTLAFFEFKVSGATHELFGYGYDGSSLSATSTSGATRLAARTFVFEENIYVPARILNDSAERAILLDSTYIPVSILSIDTEQVDIAGLGIYSNEIGIPLGVSQYGSSLVQFSTSNFSGSTYREIQDSTFIAAGAGFVFDGAVYSECGFIVPPADLGNAISGGAGAVPAGTYNYALTYSYTDLSGSVYESAPVFTDAITIASPKNISISTSVCPSRRSDEKNFVKLYRQDTDGVYKLTATKSFVDIILSGSITDSRTSLSGQPTLYTTGGVLQNDPAPPCNIFSTHGDRVFCVNEERPTEVYFSKKVQPGEGIHFSSFLYFSVNENKNATYERVTGLGSLDDKFIVFKNNSIYAIFGDGPNALGVGSFSDPKLVSSDVGCRDARSIVSTSEGLMFMSAKGIYLLTRSLEVQYVGADVETYNDKEITSAILLPLINQVRFTTRDGVALIYSYYFKQWAWFTNYEAQHAAVWKNKIAHLKNNGSIMVESTSFSDVATSITQRIASGWIKLNGVQNLQRVSRISFIGDYKSTHKVKAKLYYDYEEYAWEEVTITPRPSGYNATSKPTLGDIYTGGNTGVYEFEIQLSRQKCSAFKVEFYDFDHTGESFSISAMSLIAGLKKGLNKIASNKKF